MIININIIADLNIITYSFISPPPLLHLPYLSPVPGFQSLCILPSLHFFPSIFPFFT